MIKKKYTTIYDFLDDISFTNWVHQNNGTDIELQRDPEHRTLDAFQSKRSTLEQTNVDL